MRVSLLLLLMFIAVRSLATAIDTVQTPVIGGIRQYISIKGKDKSHPLLLFLHGGPGGSVLSYADKFSSRLQEHFIVVHWDQRETGETLSLNHSPDSLTFSLFQNDTRDLIQFLLKQFHRDKLYLVGHSWGTALGFQMVRQFPDLLYAYVSIGSMVNQLESERLALDHLQLVAKQQNNSDALQELMKVTIPFPNGTQLYYHRKWLLYFSGSKRPLSKDYVLEWSQRWLRVFNEASEVNLFDALPVAACPVYFFAGAKDYQTNSWITETYYQTLPAPRKNFFWFEKSGHSIPTTEPAKLQALIIEKILPETLPGLH